MNKGDGQTAAAPPKLSEHHSRWQKEAGTKVQDEIEGAHKRGLAHTAKLDEGEPVFGGQGLVATAA